MTTNELLRRYVADRSDAAFAELVSQHINLVYSAALRQVNGDSAAAQDVTQAVFTDLARKAPALALHTSLTGWLYTSTRYLAANARRTENRRRAHEQEAHAMNLILESAPPDPAWQELRPLLDEAMHQLSPADREAVLLRYFERLPLAQIGAKLGLSENTARKRVDRAIEKLRAVLAKRGITSSITALAAILTERAVAAAPAGLAGRISVAAVASAATGSALGWALLKLAAFVNAKTVAAASAAVLLIGVAVAPKLLPAGTWFSASTVRASTQAQTADADPSAGATGVGGAANFTTKPGTKLKLSPGALWHPTPGNYNNVLTTDDKGCFALAADEAVIRIIAVHADGYVEATPAALIAKPMLQLKPWGRLAGTFLSDGKPAVGSPLVIANTNLLDGFMLDGNDFSCQPDANGHFEFPKLPPGTFKVVDNNSGVFRFATPLTETTIRPGETTTVSLAICTVTAQVRWPAGLTPAPGWKLQGGVYQGTKPQRLFAPSSTDALKIEGLPPGDYSLHVDVIEPGTAADTVMRRFLGGGMFSVPANPTGPLDLGEIMLQPAQ